MNIEYIIPLVCFWQTISREIVKYQPLTMSNNIVAFIHCISFIAHYNYDYNLDYAVHLSIGFYVYDLIYIFSSIYNTTRENTKYDQDYDYDRNRDRGYTYQFNKHRHLIIHHIVGMSILYGALTGESREHILGGYNIIEKSNIMLYISYYLHKKYANYRRIIILSDFIQLIIYSYYRLVGLSLFVYHHNNVFVQFHFTTQLFIAAIHGMGVVWSYRLLKQNISNVYTVIRHC